MRSTLVRSTLAIAVVFAAACVQAETKVTLTQMHLCCGVCLKAVQKAVDGVEGATVELDKKAGSAIVTAGDDAAAQKAVDAIAAAGFHGKSDNEKIVVADDSGVKAGKVRRLALSGVHNCCGGCNKAIQKALASVDGVQANTAKAKEDAFVVEGSFDAAALVAALNKAGFHVKLKSE